MDAEKTDLKPLGRIPRMPLFKKRLPYEPALVSSSPQPPNPKSPSYIIPPRPQSTRRWLKIFGTPLVELYYVKVKNWDKSMFDVIEMEDQSFKIIVRGSATSMQPEVVFQCEPEEEVPIGTPLYLKGPRYPHSADSDFLIYLVHRSWGLWRSIFNRSCKTEPLQICPITDLYSDSEAEIYCGVFEKATMTELEFTFVCNADLGQDHKFIILAGSSLSVTNDGQPYTYRPVRLFSKHQTLKLGDPFPLDRISFVVPINSALVLDLNLAIATVSPKYGSSGHRLAEICGRTEFSVPKIEGQNVAYIHQFRGLGPLVDIAIQITVTWTVVGF